MEPYTSMSTEGIEAVIAANERQPKLRYAMELNRSDFANFMWALQAAHANAEDDETADWAGSFASNIAQTLGIEFI